jgi:CBS domain-containing protein
MKVARVPAPTVPATTTIKDAIPSMKIDSGCSLGVVEDGRLVGTLSKDDILQRVVATGLDPATTPVSEAMTKPPVSVDTETEMEDALKLMTERHQCFMPVVDKDGAVAGWLAVCHMLEENVEMLSEQLDIFAGMLGRDGPGG